MSGFVSIAPAPPECTGDACIVHADGWFPPIDLSAMRDTMRVGTAVTTARLREAVLSAMATVLRDLFAWRTAQVLEGVDSVEAVPGEQLDGVSIYAHHWRRAIYNHACAVLAETHRDISATTDGADRAEEKALSAEDYRRDGLHAVRDILGTTRIVAELL